jgi:ABC-type branched-subunit amino acid transport system substrate-binding protein
MHPWFAAASAAAVAIAAAGLAATDRRALAPVLATAAFVTAFSGTVLAALFT